MFYSDFYVDAEARRLARGLTDEELKRRLVAVNSDTIEGWALVAETRRREKYHPRKETQ